MARVKLTLDSMVKVGDGVRIHEIAALRCQSRKPAANCGSIIVWLGLIVGPVTSAIVKRPNRRDLSDRL